MFPELTQSLRALAVSSEDISEEPMQSLRSLWIIFMTENAASQALREGKNYSKNSRSLASIPPPERHLSIIPRGQCFRRDFSGHKPLLKGLVLPCPSQGDDSLQAVSGYTSVDNSSKTELYMLWSHPLLWCKTVCRGRCKCAKGNSGCTGLTKFREQLLLGLSFRNK